MYRLLLVDDEVNVLNALRRTLVDVPYEVETFSDPGEALARAEVQGFDLVIADYRMPGMDGIRLLGEIKRRHPDCVRLVLSAYTDLQALLEAINVAEIYRFLTKPWHDYELKATVAKALAHRALELDNRRLADQLRAQERALDRSRQELVRLEHEYPGITRVRWAEDGSVVIDEDDYSGEMPKWARP